MDIYVYRYKTKIYLFFDSTSDPPQKEILDLIHKITQQGKILVFISLNTLIKKP